MSHHILQSGYYSNKGSKYLPFYRHICLFSEFVLQIGKNKKSFQGNIKKNAFVFKHLNRKLRMNSFDRYEGQYSFQSVEHFISLSLIALFAQ